MTNASMSTSRPPPVSVRDLAELGRQLMVGFAYWFMFDVVLEPGNIAHAMQIGAPIAWDQEIIRFTGAGFLGAAATPFVLALVRRFPVEGSARWRRATIHVASAAALSATLILVSCPLVSWLLASEHRSIGEAMRAELTSNLLLLTFCMLGFVAMAHARRSILPAGKARDVEQWPVPVAVALNRIAVKARSGLLMIETSKIDWIETQGNYLAVHVGQQSHLIRDTSKHFETLLDPERFARVHRQTIVAVDRIQELTPVGSGDAIVQLVTGAQLRVSRGYREGLRARLGCGQAVSCRTPGPAGGRCPCSPRPGYRSG